MPKRGCWCGGRKWRGRGPCDEDLAMKIRIFGACALLAVAVCTFVGCAGIAQNDSEKTAPEVKVYQLGDTVPRPYEVVAHLWGDNWRSSFLLPSYPSQDLAIAALRTEA